MTGHGGREEGITASPPVRRGRSEYTGFRAVIKAVGTGPRGSRALTFDEAREALLNRVWGYDYYGGARTVDVHVRRVRAKLGSEHAARIKTVRSVGYRWEST